MTTVFGLQNPYCGFYEHNYIIACGEKLNMKWLKRIAGIFTVLSCGLIVFSRSPFGASFKVKEVGAIGIISGADGPTGAFILGKQTACKNAVALNRV